jgi:tetratricopeptide (TPR) repeat protein
MTTRGNTTLVAAMMLAASLAGASLTVRRLDRLRAGATAEEALYIPSRKILQRMSLGYTGLLADIYWTRAVQYFGGHHHVRSRQYKLLEPLLDIATTLDPHLTVAYEFGATFLAQKPPEGAGDPDAAVRLVERGVRENPSEWRLYYNLGFIHYFERKDYAAAADAFERGSRVPGALPWMKVMAADTSQHAGDLQTARFLWSSLYQTTESDDIRVNAAKHLRALQVDEEVSLLQKMASSFHERTGRWPANWAEMVAAGYLRGVPLDPTRRAYRLALDGRVLVQDPEDLPFITQGLPLEAEPSNRQQRESK